MSTPTMIVDNVGPDDVERVAQLLYDDMQDLGDNTRLSALRSLCEAALTMQDNGVLFLAAREEVGGQVVGVLLAHERLSVRFGGRALWVEELYVSPDARMGGTGRRLVRAALRWARARGIIGVDLEAYRMNTAASILYRSIGFQRLPRERYAIALDDLDWGE